MALSVRKALEYLSSQEDECEEAAYTRKGKEDPEVVCDLSFVSHLVQGSARVQREVFHLPSPLPMELGPGARWPLRSEVHLRDKGGRQGAYRQQW